MTARMCCGFAPTRPAADARGGGVPAYHLLPKAYPRLLRVLDTQDKRVLAVGQVVSEVELDG